MPDESDEALIQEILPVLEVDHQYVRTVEGWNTELIAQTRRCGRAAARRLAYKVRTIATDPADRADGRVVVCVAITHSAPAEEERLKERSELLMRQTFDQIFK